VERLKNSIIRPAAPLLWAATVFLMLAAAAGTASSQADWPEGWEYRMALEVDSGRLDAAGDRLAILDFCGAARPDGADLRLFDESGSSVPFQLLQAGPGQRYRILFPASRGRCRLYFGNPAAAAPAPADFPIRRGLWLEVYERKGDRVDTWEEARAVAEASRRTGRRLGRAAWKQVWDGANPFGPEKDVVKIYTGYFRSEAGVYEFATSSGGASFLLIDGQLTAAWPGWHGAEPFIRPARTGKVTLTAGIHELAYYQFSRSGQEITAAAVKRPGEKDFQVIPADFFLPLAGAIPVNLERRGKPVAAALTWENTHYLRRENWELLTFRFFDLSHPDSEIEVRQWDFGDGQSAVGRNPLHTYLKPGLYPVTLTVRGRRGAGSDRVRLTVPVEQNYGEMRLPSRSLEAYLEEFDRLDLDRLGNEELGILAQLYQSYDRSEAAYRCYRNLAGRRLSSEERRRAGAVAAALAVRERDYAGAAELYRQLLAERPAPEFLVKLGWVQLRLGELDQADTLFRQAETAAGARPEERRLATIGRGDVLRQRGEAEAARQAYLPLTERGNLESRNGWYDQQVLYYVRQKDFFTAWERLEAWGEELPLVKLEGAWSILAARIGLERKDYDGARQELETFLKVTDSEAGNAYRPGAVYLLGQVWEAQGERARARGFYQQVVDRYPGTSWAGLAADRIKK